MKTIHIFRWKWRDCRGL